jgi:uncharacterized protein (DUF2237 family)
MGLIMPEDRNVLGEKLDSCSIRRMTGFYRTGCCETGAEDTGAHVVCVEVTKEFPAFSKTCGNDAGAGDRLPRPAVAGACTPRAGRRRSMLMSHLP